MGKKARKNTTLGIPVTAAMGYPPLEQIKALVGSSPVVHMADQPQFALRSGNGITTPQGWVLALKRHVADLDKVAYAQRTHPKAGDVVVEISKLFAYAVASIYPDMITVGTLTAVELPADAILSVYTLRLPNGEVETWHAARFLVLPDEFLFIYYTYILSQQGV